MFLHHYTTAFTWGVVATERIHALRRHKVPQPRQPQQRERAEHPLEQRLVLEDWKPLLQPPPRRGKPAIRALRRAGHEQQAGVSGSAENRAVVPRSARAVTAGPRWMSLAACAGAQIRLRMRRKQTAYAAVTLSLCWRHGGGRTGLMP